MSSAGFDEGIHVLDPVLHRSFLAQHRTDAYTQAPLAAGDRVVVCAACGSAHLFDSWHAAGDKCCGCNNPTISRNLEGMTATSIEFKAAPSFQSKLATDKSTGRINGSAPRRPGMKLFMSILVGLLFFFWQLSNYNRPSSGNSPVITPERLESPLLSSVPTPTAIPFSTPSPSPTSLYQTPSSVGYDGLEWPDGTKLQHPQNYVPVHVIHVAAYDVLHLRSAPGTKSRIIANVPANATAITAFIQDCVQDDDGDTWCPIIWGGHCGYVGRGFIRQTD
jgi:hypothetical protein